jgi:toxin-antitoxin system PIN domain toxin
MRALLDVNLLVALIDRQHSSHLAAHRWLAQNLSHGWASCPLTENGCLRVLTNPRYPSPVGIGTALEKICVATSSPHHEFWPDDLSITDSTRFKALALQGHQQITDTYLFSLAVQHGGRLATFDKKIVLAMVPDARPDHLVKLEE